MARSTVKKPVDPDKPKRVKTPSYIVELPLRTRQEDQRLLDDRLSCAARLSNVMLQDVIEIVYAMRGDPRWRGARTIQDVGLKRQAYEAIKKAYCFNSAHFDAQIALHAKNAGFTDRIGSHEMQSVAKRVFQALEKWV
jgi:hypothetical protein